MKSLRDLGVMTKGVGLVAAVLLVFFSLLAYLSYQQHKTRLTEEAALRARLIASETVQARRYLERHLRAGGVTLGAERYDLIPVVAACRISQAASAEFDCSVRQVSERFHNPTNRPDAYEQGVLARFASDRGLQEEVAVIRQGDGPVLRYLRPLVAEKNCLACHGDPGRAPAFLHQRFPAGHDRAYGRQLGEVMGAVSVSVPLQASYSRLAGALRRDALYVAAMLMLLLLVFAEMTRRGLRRPLVQLSRGMRATARDGSSGAGLQRAAADEIGSLYAEYHALADELSAKTRHLERAERRYQDMANAVSDAIVIFLNNGQLIFANRSAQRLFGLRSEETLGGSLFDIVAEESLQMLRNAVAGAERAAEAGAGAPRVRLRTKIRNRGEQELDWVFIATASNGHFYYTAYVRPPS